MTQAIREAHIQVLRDLLVRMDTLHDNILDQPGTTGTYLRDFAQRAIDRAHEIPVDKLGRWVGYIQGVLVAQGVISVDEERNRTRPLFQEAYSQESACCEAKLEKWRQ